MKEVDGNVPPQSTAVCPNRLIVFAWIPPIICFFFISWSIVRVTHDSHIAPLRKIVTTNASSALSDANSVGTSDWRLYCGSDAWIDPSTGLSWEPDATYLEPNHNNVASSIRSISAVPYFANYRYASQEVPWNDLTPIQLLQYRIPVLNTSETSTTAWRFSFYIPTAATIASNKANDGSWFWRFVSSFTTMASVSPAFEIHVFRTVNNTTNATKTALLSYPNDFVYSATFQQQYPNTKHIVTASVVLPGGVEPIAESSSYEWIIQLQSTQSNTSPPASFWRQIFPRRAVVEASVAAVHVERRAVPEWEVEPPSAQVTAAKIFINAGCEYQYLDHANRLWSADSYVLGGHFSSTMAPDGIANSLDPFIYQTNRQGDDVRYDIPVRNGIYNVTLHFAEVDPAVQVGDRVFTVRIENIDPVEDLDLMILGKGQRNTALQIVTPNVAVRDGLLYIGFRTIVPWWALWRRFVRNNALSPLVSGIEIRTLRLFSGSTATLAPMGSPAVAPVALGAPTPAFPSVFFDVGSTIPYLDERNAIQWEADQYFYGGNLVFGNLLNHSNDTVLAIGRELLQTQRTGEEFSYAIPVPPGNYDIRMYFAELDGNVQPGERLFSIEAEGLPIFDTVDVLANGNASSLVLVLSKPYEITDGTLSLKFLIQRGSLFPAVLSALEIVQLGVHYAHAVSGGPYRGVVQPTTGNATILVDASSSHTHAPGLQLTQWVWKLTSSPLSTVGEVIGSGELTQLTLPVGVHTIILTVVDNGGNESSERTTITVYSSDYPDVTGIVPKNGPLFGGNFVTITGSGYTYPSNVTMVRFGAQNFTGSRIQILNPNTIRLRAPTVRLPSLIEVSVITPKGESKSAIYSYESSVPILFNTAKLASIDKPLRIKFGPDGKLYVSTGNGSIIKMTIDDSYNILNTIVAQVTSSDRYITGLAFDPIDTDPTRIYFSHNRFFHGEWRNSCNEAINGKVSSARGTNLDVVVDIVTGLPVADLDHGILAIEFGDNGELYISSGSNTNGGIPGPLTSKSLQKDNVLSSAILVAYLSKPGFNGTVIYDAPDDGNQVGGLGFVEVFAPGLRNPFGLTIHSNGNIYVVDNGPNEGYGDMAMGCDGKTIPDVEEEDRLHLIERGKYYGQPNLKRGQSDPRQCIWRRWDEAGSMSSGYTPPIGRPLSSSTGLIEFQSDHFDGQLRYSLISSQYKGGLYRTILSSDGRSVLPESNPPVLLSGDDTLDLVQGPDGSIFDTRYLTGAVYYYKPFVFSASGTSPKIYSVYPRRGSLSGGRTLTIYGVNLWSSSTTTRILLGDSDCPIIASAPPSLSTKIQCVTPPRNTTGTVNIAVAIAPPGTPPVNIDDTNTGTFKNGYRYITGMPS